MVKIEPVEFCAFILEDNGYIESVKTVGSKRFTHLKMDDGSGYNIITDMVSEKVVAIEIAN